jgi:ABC-type Fe3+ transport system substrate-binding protein
VIVYGPAGSDARKALADAFQQKYGIQVEYHGGRGTERIVKIKAERDAGHYTVDFHIGGLTTPLTSLKPIGALDPLALVLILPEVRDPKYWQDGKLPWYDKEQLFLPALYRGRTSVTVNTNLVKPDEIRSYRDFLNPKWKDRIILDDPRGTGPGQQLFTFFLLHRELGEPFIRALAKQGMFVTNNRTLERDMLGHGKRAILLGGAESVMETAAEKGLPVTHMQTKEFKEGGQVAFGGSVLNLINKAPHPNAARIYVNWFFSREGQTIITRELGFASRRVDVPTDHLKPWHLARPNDFLIDSEEANNAKDDVVRLAKELFGP